MFLKEKETGVWCAQFSWGSENQQSIARDIQSMRFYNKIQDYIYVMHIIKKNFILWLCGILSQELLQYVFKNIKERNKLLSDVIRKREICTIA